MCLPAEFIMRQLIMGAGCVSRCMRLQREREREGRLMSIYGIKRKREDLRVCMVNRGKGNEYSW